MAENFDLIFGSSASQSYSWNDSDYQNGWQTVGDTPPTREQFDALQRRADLKAQELNNRLAPIEENDTHDYRQSSTAYTAGQIAYHATLPTGWYLECTTAGTTGTGELVISGTVAPNTTTVSDGTVVWTVRQGASTKNLEGFVNDWLIANPNTSRLYTLADDRSLDIMSGNNFKQSTRLSLFGINSGNPGKFQMTAYLDSSQIATMIGSPNGDLTWTGNDLAGSAIVAKSLGTNGYIKYASGLIIQWGTFTSRTSSATHTVSFPITFPTKTLGILAVSGFNVVAIGDYTTSAFNAYTYQAGPTLSTSSREVSGVYFAIGY